VRVRLTEAAVSRAQLAATSHSSAELACDGVTRKAWQTVEDDQRRALLAAHDRQEDIYDFGSIGGRSHHLLDEQVLCRARKESNVFLDVIAISRERGLLSPSCMSLRKSLVFAIVLSVAPAACAKSPTIPAPSHVRA
jgi:hypothetical protein